MPLAVFSDCKQYTNLLRRGSLSVSKSKDRNPLQRNVAALHRVHQLSCTEQATKSCLALVGKTKPTSSYSTYNLATLGPFE